MRLPGMGDAPRSAFLQAPRTANSPVDSVPRPIKDPSADATDKEQRAQGQMLDGRGLAKKMWGGGASALHGGGLAKLNVPMPATFDGDGKRLFELSPTARRFRELGVDPTDYSLKVQQEKVNFKLSMQDEDLRISTNGSINYSSEKVDLDVSLTTTEGVRIQDGREVHFKKVSFSLNFSWEQTRASVGEGDPEQPTEPTDFASRKADFMASVMDKVREMARAEATDGEAIQADEAALESLGNDVGERLFSLVQGVMDIAAAEPKRVLYDPFRGAKEARAAADQSDKAATVRSLKQAQERLTRPGLQSPSTMNVTA